MTAPSIVVVVFDQVSRDEFFRRLDWPVLVRAWSKTVHWQSLSRSTIRLDLDGVDGMRYMLVTRRYRGNKIFIGARDSEGSLVQTGVWEWDEEAQLAVCYRRIYKPEVASLLRERLADFCFHTFIRNCE